jgi:hypothetical protein
MPKRKELESHDGHSGHVQNEWNKRQKTEVSKYQHTLEHEKKHSHEDIFYIS